ncbi:surface-associated interspersed protein (SURFIN) [Plasmodium gallinaceum]|uniref:Surface-associated interspersed protein (SURFIN) n=1 Tax=Plasmodium gallinaceum TaxID=5849 RepID=A0A1J1GQ03_PLAGA|nr:surface-associated interspersed protein (SURFIN) [Plasmodium gallinaceum]CRG94505.1 surface-associated interspersed protein (SURFIN) [Plasmodium gallinaceum]
MLHINFLLLFFQYVVIKRIYTSQELENDEENFHLKIYTTDNEDKLSISKDEIKENANINLLLHLNSPSNPSNSTSHNSDCNTANLSDASYCLETNTSDLEKSSSDPKYMSSVLHNTECHSEFDTINLDDLLSIFPDKIFDSTDMNFDLQDMNFDSTDMNFDLQDMNFDLQDMNFDLQDMNFDIQDMNFDLQDVENNSQYNTNNLTVNTPNSQNSIPYLKNNSSDLENTNSISHYVETYPEYGTTHFQNMVPSFENSAFNSQNIENNSDYNTANLSDASYCLETNTSYLEKSSSDTKYMSSVLHNTECDSELNEINLDDVLSILPDTIFDSTNMNFDLQDMENNSQYSTNNLSGVTSNIKNNISNYENASSNSKNKNSNISRIIHNSEPNNINLENTFPISKDRDCGFPNINFNLQYFTPNLQYTYINLQNIPYYIQYPPTIPEKSNSSLQEVSSGSHIVSCSSNLNYYEEKNKLSHEKKKEVIRRKKKKKLNDTNSSEDNSDCTKMSTSSHVMANVKNDNGYYIRRFCLFILKNVFTVSLEEFETNIIPDMQTIYNDLKMKYNMIVEKINLNSNPFKIFIEGELKDINQDYLDNLKLQYDNIFKNKEENTEKININRELDTLVVKLTNKKVTEELLNLILYLRIFLRELNSFNKGSKLILNFVDNMMYTKLLSTNFLNPSSKNKYLFKKILKGTNDLISCIEKSHQCSYFFLDKSKVKIIREHIRSLRLNLNSFYRIADKCFEIVKSLNLSDRDHKIKVQTIFHFLSETNTLNTNCAKNIIDNHYVCGDIKVFNEILSKERNRISDFKQRTSEIFHINGDELNLNNTHLGSLLISKEKAKVKNLHNNLMKMFSFTYMHNLLNNIAKILNSPIFKYYTKKNMSERDYMNYKLSKMENFKNILRIIELNIQYITLFNSLKKNIFYFPNLIKFAKNKTNELLHILEKLREIIKKKSISDDDETEEINSSQQILYYLIQATELMNKFSIEKLK